MSAAPPSGLVGLLVRLGRLLGRGAPPPPVTLAPEPQAAPPPVAAQTFRDAQTFRASQVAPIELTFVPPKPPKPRTWDDAVAPLAPHGPKLVDVKRKLLERAKSLGHATIDTPELRLHVMGGDVLPVWTDGRKAIFSLARGGAEMRLRSRIGVPMEVFPESNDDRRLGVFVRKIAVFDGRGRITLTMDDPALVEGWYPAEVEDGQPCRWTNGDALIPLPPDRFRAGVTVEIDVLRVLPYWP